MATTTPPTSSPSSDPGTLPSTMRAWRYRRVAGGMENNLTLDAVPVPTPTRTQHLLRVRAVALNPVDYKPAEIPWIGRLLVRGIATPGVDIVGTVVVPAAASSGVQRGQRVVGFASAAVFAAGGLAEYVATEAELVTVLPDGVGLADGATLPVAGLSAYQALVSRVRPHAGEWVLVNGGSGGVGHVAIQVAKAMGCRVTATCSGRNREFCEGLGADEVVEYDKVGDGPGGLVEALKRTGHAYAVVMDNVGHDRELYWRCHEYTVPGAEFVLIGRTDGLEAVWFSLAVNLWPAALGGGQRKMVMQITQPNVEQLAQLVKWMQEGKVKAQTEARFPFEQAPDAFRKLRAGRTRGKIVVEVSSTDV